MLIHPGPSHKAPQSPNAVPATGIHERMRFRKPHLSTKALTSASPSVGFAACARSSWFVAPMKMKVYLAVPTRQSVSSLTLFFPLFLHPWQVKQTAADNI